jgi:hypothetical protein
MGSVLYPTWLWAMVTMRWRGLRPARVAGLGSRKESVFANTPCRVATRMTTTAPTPRTSPKRRRDRPRWRDRTALPLRILALETGPSTLGCRGDPLSENAEPSPQADRESPEISSGLNRHSWSHLPISSRPVPAKGRGSCHARVTDLHLVSLAGAVRIGSMHERSSPGFRPGSRCRFRGRRRFGALR